MKAYEVTQYELFPQTLLSTNICRDYTDKELNFIKSQDTKKNIGNRYGANNYILNEPELEDLKHFCSTFLETYCRKVLNMHNNIKPYITQSWINVAEKNEYHHAHRHPNSFIAGVLYISEGPNIIKFLNSDPPEFDWTSGEHEDNNTSLLHAVQCTYPRGALILFPARTMHEVPPVQEEESRISLAFNSFLSGQIGLDENLEGLQL